MRKAMNYILIFIFIFSCACVKKKDCHKTIVFRNNSDKTIYIDYGVDYPDTLNIPARYQNPVLQPDVYKVSPYSKNENALWRRTCYEGSLKNGIFHSGIIMIYVFDAEVLDTVLWETVKEENMILKRYDLSLEDLQMLNWEVPYPPSEAMKDMEMYPPYGQ
jgi:hypothetical protein